MKDRLVTLGITAGFVLFFAVAITARWMWERSIRAGACQCGHVTTR